MKKLLLTLAVSLVGMFAASADELASITLTKSTFGRGVQDYISSWNATEANAKWTLNNFNNNNKGWDFVKCIAKNATDGTAYIQTDFAVAGTVNEVVLNAKKGCNVTGTIKVLTASTDAFTETESKEVGSIAISLGTTAADVKIPVSATAADQYVRILFTGTNGTKTNGAVWVYSVKINGTPAGETPLKPANLSFPEESYTAYLGEPFVAPTLKTKDTDAAVSYISTVESVAKVSADGAVEIVGLGTTVIKATTPATDTYYAGSAQYTLTVLDPNTLYSNACTSSDCGFTQVATTGTPWQIDTTYGLKASGYISGKNTATDAIMASPVIDLNARQNVELDFEQAVNNFKANRTNLTGADMAQINNYISVVICTNPNARAAEEWIKLADVQLPETQGWTFYANPTIKIDNKYAGRYVKIGFRYVSTADMAGTWEIKNVTVKAQPETSAVENIAVSDEDALVEYYNLQGVRVAEPANGIFIRRQGNSVSKVYIR